MDDSKGLDNEMFLPVWESIAYIGDQYNCSKTHRMKVFGGWLVKEFRFHQGEVSTSITFVPDRNHEWRTE